MDGRFFFKGREINGLRDILEEIVKNLKPEQVVEVIIHPVSGDIATRIVPPQDEETKKLWAKLNLPINEFEMSTRLYVRLDSANIRFLGELVQKPERDLRHIRGLGRRTMKEIYELLASQGLSHGMDLRGWTPPVE